MAIHDYDGTTKYEIGVLHDYDGTTKSQIAKVWDYNGTTKYVIYALARDIIGTSKGTGYTYTDGWSKYTATPQLEVSSDSSIVGTANDKTDDRYWDNVDTWISTSSTTGALTLAAKSNYPNNERGMVNAFTKTKIDLSGYEKIYIVVDTMYSPTNDETGFLGIASSVPADGSLVGNDKQPNSSGNYSSNVVDNAATIKFVNNHYKSFTNTGTYSLDVTDYQGEYYICLSLRTDYYDATTENKMIISNLYLE